MACKKKCLGAPRTNFVANIWLVAERARQNMHPAKHVNFGADQAAQQGAGRQVAS